MLDHPCGFVLLALVFLVPEGVASTTPAAAQEPPTESVLLRDDRGEPLGAPVEAFVEVGVPAGDRIVALESRGVAPDIHRLDPLPVAVFVSHLGNRGLAFASNASGELVVPGLPPGAVEVQGPAGALGATSIPAGGVAELELVVERHRPSGGR